MEFFEGFCFVFLTPRCHPRCGVHENLNISVQKTELVTVEVDTTVYIGFIGQIYVTKNLTYIVASALAVIDSVLCENSD